MYCLHTDRLVTTPKMWIDDMDDDYNEYSCRIVGFLREGEVTWPRLVGCEKSYYNSGVPISIKMSACPAIVLARLPLTRGKARIQYQDSTYTAFLCLDEANSDSDWQTKETRRTKSCIVIGYLSRKDGAFFHACDETVDYPSCYHRENLRHPYNNKSFI